MQRNAIRFAPFIAALVLAAPALAQIRPELTDQLQQAMQLSTTGDYRGALAVLDKAAALQGKTAEEQKAIAQLRTYLAAKAKGAS